MFISKGILPKSTEMPHRRSCAQSRDPLSSILLALLQCYKPHSTNVQLQTMVKRYKETRSLMSTMTGRKIQSGFVLRRLPAMRTPRHVDISPNHRVASRAPQQSADRIPPQTTTEPDMPVAKALPAKAGLNDGQTKTVSVKEAAFRLRTSPDSVYAWLRRGRLLGLQPGGPRCQIQVVESSIEQALKRLPGRPAIITQAV